MDTRPEPGSPTSKDGCVSVSEGSVAAGLEQARIHGKYGKNKVRRQP